MDELLWWRDGSIYQICSRSFADKNADGLNGLPSITSRPDTLLDPLFQWI